MKNIISLGNQNSSVVSSMNKVIFKESNKYNLCAEILLYLLITIIGFVILLSSCLKVKILYNVYAIFFIIAALSLVAYFVSRKKYDYELLMFTLINVFVGSFALLNYKYFNEFVVLSMCIFMYTAFNATNKWYYAALLNSRNDAYVVSKASITFLLTVLGLFVAISFYFKSLIAHEYLGYYFIAFGLLSLLEPFMKILIRNNIINKYLTEEKNIKKEKSVKVITKEKVKPKVVKKEEPKKVAKTKAVKEKKVSKTKKVSKKNNVKEK